MEKIIAILQAYLAQDFERTFNLEDELYSFVDETKDFHPRKSLTVDPQTFLLAVVHRYSSLSLLEEQQFLQVLQHLDFFKDNGQKFADLCNELRSFSFEEIQAIQEEPSVSGQGIWQKLRFRQNNLVLLAKQRILEYFQGNDEVFAKFVRLYQEVGRPYFDAYFAYIHVLEKLNTHPKMNIKRFKKEDISLLKTVYTDFATYKRSREERQKKAKNEFLIMQGLCQIRIKKLKKAHLDTYLSLTKEEMQFFPLELQKELEAFFLEHNMQIFQQLNAEIARYSKERKQRFQALFAQYAIPFFQDERKKTLFLEMVDESTLGEKLSLIAQNKLPLSEEKLLFFLSQNLESVQKVSSFLHQEVFTLSFFVQEMTTIFSIDMLQNIERNIKLVREKTKVIQGLDEVLLFDSMYLQHLLSLLELYQLKVDKQSILNSMNPHYFEAIDLWIENGFYDKLAINLPVIGFQIEMITKRMLIAKSLNLPLFDEQGYLSSIFLREDKFFLLDEELEDYIEKTNFSISFIQEWQTNHIQAISQLDKEYYIDPLTYKIAGRTISRPKMIRTMSCLPISEELPNTISLKKRGKRPGIC